LSPVGKPLPYPKKKEEVQSLFRHLWMLHEHNVTHGDPRVPNVIVHEGKRLWIDLVESREMIHYMKRDDVKLLTRSILWVSVHDKLEEKLEKLIENYGESSTRENIERVAKEVSKHLQK
jgi:tRNA A-37 threonylcarbamoyl transferase component Bud32